MKKLLLILSLLVLVNISSVSINNKPVMCPMGMLMAASEAHAMEVVAVTEYALQQQQPQPTPPVEGDQGDGQDQPAQPQCDPRYEGCQPVHHTEPTQFCTPVSRPDGKLPCGCLKQHPEGCKAGQREQETPICNSYCWKKYCHCCNS